MCLKFAGNAAVPIAVVNRGEEYGLLALVAGEC